MCCSGDVRELIMEPCRTHNTTYSLVAYKHLVIAVGDADTPVVWDPTRPNCQSCVLGSTSDWVAVAADAGTGGDGGGDGDGRGGGSGGGKSMVRCRCCCCVDSTPRCGRQ